MNASDIILVTSHNNKSYQTNTLSHKASIDYQYIVAIAYVFIQTTICSIGFILNIINFSVFICKKFSASAYILMTVLSLADAITLGVRIPQGCIFLPHLNHHATDAAIYIYMYSIYVETPVSNMTENISAWLTVALAIERYVSMKHWSLSKRYFTRKTTRQLIASICIIAFIFNIPYFAIQRVSLKYVDGVLQLHSDLTSFSRSTYYAFYSWLRIVFVQIIPLCFLCVSNCLLFILVSHHNRRFTNNKMNNNTNSKENKLSGNTFGISKTHKQRIQVDDTSQDSCTDAINNFGEQKLITESNLQSIQENELTIPEKMVDRDEVQSTSRKNTHDNNDNDNNNNSSIKTKKPILQDRSKQRRQNAQRKLTILLIAVILLFLIGQVPQSLAYVRVFTTLGVCSIDQIQTCVTYHLYRMITINLAQFAFASTFFLYLFLNRDFRETLRFICCRLCQKCKISETNQRLLRETNYLNEPPSNFPK
ncbi:G-protein coupled receptor fragment, putative [Schistosoma mansoni]|uniref:G-protein coupled receptor, putative n=1 Tax=Schistosoma mansoni TaxID=6183 RepID=G4LUC7_SCHMA|nr:G-protein coupled receptor fragment, putative [Schistosoma mansoni]